MDVQVYIIEVSCLLVVETFRGESRGELLLSFRNKNLKMLANSFIVYFTIIDIPLDAMCDDNKKKHHRHDKEEENSDPVDNKEESDAKANTVASEMSSILVRFRSRSDSPSFAVELKVVSLPLHQHKSESERVTKKPYLLH